MIQTNPLRIVMHKIRRIYDFNSVFFRISFIVDLVHSVGLVEKVGSGILRMKALAPNVSFKSDSNWFWVIFKRENIYLNTPQTTLTNLESEILELIKKNNNISRIEISTKLGKGEDTIKEYLSKLKKKGFLKRKGTYKGHWEVLN
jgi:ATP-dependent DNA helicase RecG